MKYAFYGQMKLGEINPLRAASSTNYVTQVDRFFDPGCHSKLDVNIENDIFESTNSCTGVETIDYIRVKGRKLSASSEFDSATRTNLRAFMQSTDIAADVAAVPVVSQTLNPATGAGAYKAGDITYLGRMNITGLALSGNAIPLVLGTDYEISPIFGKVTFLTDVTGPVVATAYNYQNPASSAILNGAQKDYVLLMDGYNDDGGAPGQIILYKIRLNLDGSFGFSTTEKSVMSVSLGVQADLSKPFGGVLGQFGQIRGFGIPQTN
jgi:hypothetical protein